MSQISSPTAATPTVIPGQLQNYFMAYYRGQSNSYTANNNIFDFHIPTTLIDSGNGMVFGTYTIPVAGVYMFMSNLQIQNITNLINFSAYITVNGTQVVEAFFDEDTINNSDLDDPRNPLVYMASFSANDEVKVQFRGFGTGVSPTPAVVIEGTGETTGPGLEKDPSYFCGFMLEAS